MQSVADKKRLVVLPSSLEPDGRRRFVHPADVSGRFALARRIVFWVLIGFWALAPLARLAGRPLIFLDVVQRRFYLFGSSFGVEDVWLLFFVVTGVAFGLAVVTALLGRVFCGWACPQTVFLEAVFRPIERLMEGPREARMRRDRGPWSAERVGRKLVKHALYLAASAIVAHIFVSLFVSLPKLATMVAASPSEHPQAFGWALVLTLLFYGNFAWFREQMCLIVCPYGRLQAALVDRDSLVIGYDQKRGEPRGKVGSEGAGDCIDCKRCVVVCPTGIDIRNGLQLDCIGCSACVDACDAIMDRVGRPRGLVRYDSQRGLEDDVRRLWRPRLAIYFVLGLVGAGVATFALSGRTDFEAKVLRPKGAPYVVEDGVVRNSFEVTLVNKRDAERTVVVRPAGPDGVRFSPTEASLTLGAMQKGTVRVVVSTPLDGGAVGQEVRFEVDAMNGRSVRAPQARIVGPVR